MQHVLRCCERQSDSTEYKKTLRRPGLRWGSLHIWVLSTLKIRFVFGSSSVRFGVRSSSIGLETLFLWWSSITD